MAVFLIGVQNSTDWRAKINDGWFPVKFLALVGLIVAAFFIPNSFFAVYGNIAHTIIQFHIHITY